MKKIIFKKINTRENRRVSLFSLAILFFILCSLSILYQIYMENTFQIYEGTLRFHVRADSDSPRDQQSKLAVRDAVLALLEEDVKTAGSADVLEESLAKRRDEIEDTAEEVLGKDSGQDDAVKVNVYFAKERFPIRTYGTAVFPAGEYDTLRIDLGAAKGQNWWCAFYPSLCYTPEKNFSLSKKGKKDIQKTFSRKERKTLFGRKIKLRFKLLKWISKL